ncbi:MAG: FHIPEP family type III secretion protein [Candidatus Eremiobacteraeota bacterium]|nr:FHIPEP family type III secretion protein [Candidatus Eremiobacteraeota bacterium]
MTTAWQKLEERLESLQPPELLLRLGPKLAPLLDPTTEGQFYTRVVTGLAAWSRDWGIPVPEVSFAPGHDLPPNLYQIEVDGRIEASGESNAVGVLVVGSPATTQVLLGVETNDPIYHLPGKWISATQAARAQELGCVVFDPAGLMTAHILEVLGRMPDRMIHLDSLAPRLDRVARRYPVLAEEVKRRLGRAELVGLFRHLAHEKVAVGDVKAILEAVVTAVSPDEEVHTSVLDRVRSELGRLICRPYLGEDGYLAVATLTKSFEQQLKERIDDHELPVDEGEEFLHSLSLELDPLLEQAPFLALVVDFELRSLVRALTDFRYGHVPVLAWAELPPEASVEVLMEVGCRLHPRARPFPRDRFQIERG